MKPLISLILLFLLWSCTHSKTESDTTSSNFSQLTEETKALYFNLKEIAKTKVLFGHQDDVAYGIGWWGGNFNSDVEKVSGDYPAVFGWDIGHIDSTRNIDSVLFSDMHNWIAEAYSRGGIITVGWHQRNLASGGNSWDVTPVVERMLEGGDLNQAFNAQLDKVAEFFNACQTKEGIKIPILFRPYHEHNGGWFWWGNSACSDDYYKKLWIYTYNYLRNRKHLKNVLFTYSTDAFEGRDEYLSRYPGDEYVDILGWDDYKSIRTTDTRNVFHKRIKVVNDLAREKGKIACLAETGYETLSASGWWTDILLEGIKTAPESDHIAYLLVWRNARTNHHYAPYPGHASVNDFLKFKEDSSVVFLGDLPDMYHVD